MTVGGVDMGAKHARGKLPSYKPKGRTRGNPLTTIPDYDADELEFLKAVDTYKREKKRPFPSNSEILAILKKLGWKKVPPAEAANRAR